MIATATTTEFEAHLLITDANVLKYLSQFTDEMVQQEKLLEALRIGVTAIQSASPTLDTGFVENRFGDLELQLKEYLGEFQKDIQDGLERYLQDGSGVLPKKLDDLFGDSGQLGRVFSGFFDPESGKLSRLMESHVGPESPIGRTLNPSNKHGVVAILESRVKELVQEQLEDVTRELSLDTQDSAMSRLQQMLTESFGKLNRALGQKEGTDEEAKKGHVKGIRFEKELYHEFFADLCIGFDDEPALVRGISGHLDGNKTGDLMSTLGESTGAPGANIVVEVKDREVKLKDARAELQEAKLNRKAAVGIFVFAEGTEPAEVGDFRRIGDDFFCTVSKDDLAEGRPLLYLDTAYRIARAMAVAAQRKESASEVDLSKIENHVEALGQWAARLTEMAKKAKTIRNNGQFIEDLAHEMKVDIDERIQSVLNELRE